MCGLSGYHGVRGEHTKLMLTLGLAQGIDVRGGDSSGYVSVSNDGLRFAKKCGEWLKARMKFLKGAAQGDMLMMHARYGTVGPKDVVSAHPYAIRREGKVVLWGAHNGVIHNANSSAKDHNREFSVDSKELFELLADKEYDNIRKLNGYGVITWIDATDPHHVNMAKLSSNADMHVVMANEGGIVWGSTKQIVENAMDMCGLSVKFAFQLDEVGRVYTFNEDNVYITKMDGIKLGSYASYGNHTRHYCSGYDWTDDEEVKEHLKKWREQEEPDEEKKWTSQQSFRH